ncbi:two-component regulator propeller domain-containing protein, partial [Bacteroides heparinolyticus]|uniref:two-component regulator propeller domain-containing protein n=1 Tax=Prevotella heparinolytica TaxID=28113 RepID=UPI0035A06EF4
MRDKWVRGILKDAEGKMWIGANGIFIFNTNKELQDSITHDNGFPIRSVSHLIKDAQNRILTATVDGIIIFKNQRQPREYTFYGTSEGLKNTNVRAIQQDKYGKIWISTNAGISYLDEAKRKFYNYNHHDGIPIGDFMDGATCMTSDGTIYFGSQDGACYFSPNEVTSSCQAIPAVITQFSVYSRQIESKDTELPLSLRDKIELLYNQNTFKISFNVLDYTQNSQVEFAYMMEGLEDVWYSTQGENQVTFRNIPPGDYTFK